VTEPTPESVPMDGSIVSDELTIAPAPADELTIAPAPAADEALYLHDVSKRFGATQALDGVSMLLRVGEVHGLVGANGSGKSTLVKILAGYHTPDTGQVRINGAMRHLPLSAHDRRGIATIHQDLGLVEGLSALENIVVTSRFGAAPGRPIKWSAERRVITDLAERMQITLKLRSDVKDLAPGERTLVAVTRAMVELERARAIEDSDEMRVLILDEPTAALSEAESGVLWELLRNITGTGGAALLISHHLQEIRDHCDRATVLRDGRLVLTTPCADITEGSLVRSMLGDTATQVAKSTSRAGRATQQGHTLSVTDLRSATLHGLSFGVERGEVVGVVGLIGMGQDELPYLIAGADRPLSGQVKVDGRALRPGDLAAARRAGVALVPQERLRDGLWVEADSAENLSIVDPRRFMRGGRYRRRLELEHAVRWIDHVGVVPRDPTLAVSGLSGGNQQKLLIAKWLQINPAVALLHEPTQGVDVGAKFEIHKILREFARETGAAICVCSSDLEEMEEICDRVIVLRHGRVAGALSGSEVRSHSIVSLATAA
jgi:ribose transport system ATP-binding protein